MTPRIVFHLPRSWLGPAGKVLPFYRRLGDGLRARGVPFDWVPLDRARVMDEVAADRAFHIVNHGRFIHDRVLNSGIAYVYPFWNLDPQGIRAFSSIGALRFDPASVDPEIARPFFRRLRQRLVGTRQSRYPQPQARAPGLPAAAVAVFLQSEGHRNVGETLYLDRWRMLETVLAGTDAPVIVKPHPRETGTDTRAGLDALQRRYPQLHVSDGNIHDLIGAAARVVTINSAVGIEAYLHRKPVILCGAADFHHIADTARSEADLARLLARPVRARHYDKYIWWYFGHHCLSTTDPDLTGRFLERLAQQGFRP